MLRVLKTGLLLLILGVHGHLLQVRQAVVVYHDTNYFRQHRDQGTVISISPQDDTGVLLFQMGKVRHYVSHLIPGDRIRLRVNNELRFRVTVGTAGNLGLQEFKVTEKLPSCEPADQLIKIQPHGCPFSILLTVVCKKE